MRKKKFFDSGIEENVWDRDDCFVAPVTADRLDLMNRVIGLAQKRKTILTGGAGGDGGDDDAQDDFEILDHSDSSSDNESDEKEKKITKSVERKHVELEEEDEQVTDMLGRLEALFTAGRWEGMLFGETKGEIFYHISQVWGLCLETKKEVKWRKAAKMKKRKDLTAMRRD